MWDVWCMMRCGQYVIWRYHEPTPTMRFPNNIAHAMVYTFQEVMSTWPPELPHSWGAVWQGPILSCFSYIGASLRWINHGVKKFCYTYDHYIPVNEITNGLTNKIIKKQTKNANKIKYNFLSVASIVNGNMRDQFSHPVNYFCQGLLVLLPKRI